MKEIYRYLAFAGVVSAVVMTACGGPPVRIPGDTVPVACELWPGPQRTAGQITVALPRAADPGHAPWARDEGEHLLFRHLYETLVYIDCLGGIRAGLADRWERSEGGHCWTFRIREDARFWDGSPVTARDVAESWLDAAVRPFTRAAGIDSTVVEGPRVVKVYFTRPFRDVPGVLSELAFAVTRPPAVTRWPVGSGPYRIVGPAPGSRGRSIELVPVGGARGPSVFCPVSAIGDPRDLLDGGADLTVTADPDVIDYAAGRPELETIPLPWNRTYVLLSPARAYAVGEGRRPGGIPEELRDGMARDAVRRDARGCREPFWWQDVDDCEASRVDLPWTPPVPRGANPASGVRRVVYDASDPVAADLAGRIVALAAIPPERSRDAEAVRAALPGLTDTAFGVIADGTTLPNLEDSLWEGEDFAYIVALPVRPADACLELNRLVTRAPWLVVSGGALSRVVVPLVDTRSHAIVNGDRVGLASDNRGVFLLLEAVSREDGPS